ncbi:MAG: tetratricopeptide repeat protein [Muribaculaceae bacterium]|nr:tetratricopeptide repeat protein [Muribaculaceae bacterium]
MAKKQNQSARTTLEEVNQSLSTAAQRMEDNKKYIYWALGVIAVLVLLAVGYIYGVRNPNIQKATDQIGKADLEQLQGNNDEALKGYEKVFDAFSNKPAERAALNAAILLYQKGQYKEAAQYLEKYNPEGNIVAPAAMSLLGDCYVNQKQLDKALTAFDKAINLANGNDMYAPMFMLKKATVLHEQKKYAEEAALYQDVKDNYPAYVQNYRLNVDKYIERANALAGK